MVNSKFVNVLVNISKLGTKTFSYLIPEELKSEIQIGQAVLAPFGTKRYINAFVVGFSDYIDEGINPKYISKIIDKTPLFNLNFLKFLEFIANYYFCPLQNILSSAIPMNFLENDKKALTKKFLKSTNKDDFKILTKRQIEILNLLKHNENILITDFEKIAKTTRKTLENLEEKGFIDIYEKEIYRNPLKIFKEEEKNSYTLSFEQQNALKQIEERFSNSNEPVLLHGITSSGKTEIYFKLIEKTIKQNKNVMFLAPEIALATQLTQRILKNFNKEDVAIWHSSISDGERFDVWEKLKHNKIKILIGARSCIFAPLKDIGLVIIDEEHDSSFKQTTPAPRYDAKFVAQKLCKLNKAKLLLGSATPDVVSYYNALKNKNLVCLNKRYNDVPLAKAVIIDMKQEAKDANNGLFSRTLINAIEKNLENHKQTILLINRRGYSTSIQCQNCAEPINCPKCSIPLVYHSTSNSLKCHYCDFETKLPSKCPKCGSEALKKTGTGTQKIEEIAQKIFKTAKIKRIDSDIMSSKTAFINLFEEFKNGETDILIGTQIIAKGLDNENVTIVGVLFADGNFNLPDFRASERGFQLLTQVAGRAGRGKNIGKVYFQSYNADFSVLENAKEQNYLNFYNEEIENREMFDYPPFSNIIRFVISSNNEIKAQKSALEITQYFKKMMTKYKLNEKIEILGPSNCVIEKIKNEYRFQILLKNKGEQKIHLFIGKLFNQIIMPKDIKIIADVDPTEIL